MMESNGLGDSASASRKVRVLLDTDANNEIDDQHAIAYLLLSGDSFVLEGITVNKTNNGGDIFEQAAEAERVIKLCGMDDQISVKLGAIASFIDIESNVDQQKFDGVDAVDLMIKRAHRQASDPLVILAIGKLTNVALAIRKDPTIIPKIKILWLGSNFPIAGEYNLDSDPESVNFVISSGALIEIAVVRYKQSTGTAMVTVTPKDLEENLVGNGPDVKTPVVGRNGGEFYNFGDYSLNLLNNCYLFGNPPSRPLYDMAAVAILKNSAWADIKKIPSVLYSNGCWSETDSIQTNLYIRENFNKDEILKDFYNSIKNYSKVEVI